MSCVVQGREDVLTLKKWIVRQDFFEGGACPEQFKHVGNTNTMSADARTAAALIGFDCDSIEAFEIH